jgi:hypothetical protein
MRPALGMGVARALRQTVVREREQSALTIALQSDLDARGPGSTKGLALSKPQVKTTRFGGSTPTYSLITTRERATPVGLARAAGSNERIDTELIPRRRRLSGG